MGNDNYMPQLIYLYIEDVGRCFYQQEFSFSNSYIVNYDKETRHLEINETNNIFKHLYGENIVNVNLIIGENGAGKSTILDLLSYQSNIMKKQFDYEKLAKEKRQYGWFAIYKLDKDTYYIEGCNGSLISNMPDRILNKKLEFSTIIRNDNWNIIKTIKPEENRKNKLELLYFPINLNDSNYIAKNNTDGLVIKRFAEKAKPLDVIKFISFGYKAIAQCISATKVECRIILDSDIIDRANPAKDLFNNNKKQFLLNVYQYNSIELGKISDRGYRRKEIVFYYEQQLKKNNIEIENYKTYDEYGYTHHSSREYNLSKSVDDEIRRIIDYLVLRFYIISNIPDYCFISSTELNIDVNEKNLSLLVGIFQIVKPKHKRYYKYKNEDEDMDWDLSDIFYTFKNISSGEQQFILNISSIYSLMEKISEERSNIKRTKLLILDEPDAFFHPEWSRKYIFYLATIMNSIAKKMNSYIQIIIATHSPFMVSDVPKENITCIKIDEKNINNRICKKTNFGLMSNIHDIMVKDFYLKSPFGEFANDYFHKLVQDIDKLDGNNEELERIQALINSIGERLIKNKLNKMLEKKIDKLSEDNIDFRKQRIYELEKKLDKLKHIDRKDNK